MATSALEIIWRTVRRARLTRVLLVYLGGSLAAIQVIDVFIDQFGLPGWVFPGALVLLVLGLPLVVTTAVIQVVHTEATESRAAAEAADPEASKTPISATPESPKPWLTWRRAILGFVFAFAAWGLFVSGYMTMRSLGIGPVGSLVAAGVLDARERLILADFENNSNDPLLGRAVTEAFRVDLSQSTIVTVADRASLDQALARMQREADEPLDLRLAREVAIREGITAVIAGEISSVGTSYVLSTELVSAASAEVLAAYRETARDSTAIIGAVDRLSKKLRERIGESLKTIRRNKPLDRVTTPSLEALRRYSQAVRATQMGEDERAIALLEEAVAIDTGFAMAYRKLGVTLNNMDREPARAIEALTAAYEHRDRLTDRERYLTLGTYYSGVTDETQKAISAYQTLLENRPDDTWALNNLALLYQELRDYARADELLSRAIELDPGDAIYYNNAIAAQVAQGEFEKAQSTLNRLIANAPDHPSAAYTSSALASARFDYKTAEAAILTFEDRYRTNPSWHIGASFTLASVAEVQGQLTRAERHVQDAMGAAEELGLAGLYVTGAVRLAIYDLMFRNAPARALQKVDGALDKYPLDSIPPLERPYILLSIFYALGEMPDRARTILTDYETVVEESERDEPFQYVADGALAMAEGRPGDAIAALRRADEGACPICSLPLLGQAYDLAGQSDSVIAVYERYVTTPWLYRLSASDWFALGGIYEQLAVLYDQRGNAPKAAHYYSRLIELWKEADPELLPRVQAARRALQALAPDRPIAG